MCRDRDRGAGAAQAAFSLGVMARFQGDGAFAERAEAISYNALPGAMSDDMWSHNYLSQARARGAARAHQEGRCGD